jgi:hypothetical protein
VIKLGNSQLYFFLPFFLNEITFIFLPSSNLILPNLGGLTSVEDGLADSSNCQASSSLPLLTIVVTPLAL